MTIIVQFSKINLQNSAGLETIVHKAALAGSQGRNSQSEPLIRGAIIEYSVKNQWEQKLLALANDAGEFYAHVQSSALPSPESRLLRAAYARCAEVTARHSRSFYIATSLLPADKRRAVRALYAFCRLADDFVDEGFEQPGLELEKMRNSLLHYQHPSPEDGLLSDVLLAWDDTRTRYQVPPRFAEQLLDGVERDLHQHRYPTFEELAHYCYGVASTVGLMSVHIIGFSPPATPYAVKLGVALQLTNILRDVGEDLRSSRLYIPQEDLAAFGLAESDLQAGRVDDRWRALMRFQIARARQIYAEAWPGLALIHPSGRRAVTAAARFYRAILDDIEAHDYDVFTRRAHVTGWGKLKLIIAN